MFLKKSNITSLNIKFVGSTQIEKYHENGRFIISNIFIDNEGANEELSVMPKPLAIGNISFNLTRDIFF